MGQSRIVFHSAQIRFPGAHNILAATAIDPSRRNEMDITKGEKCAHPVCSCVTTTGKYCSAQCEAMEKTPDIECSCEHPVCKGKID
jgi:hypothetical protein